MGQKIVCPNSICVYKEKFLLGKLGFFGPRRKFGPKNSLPQIVFFCMGTKKTYFWPDCFCPKKKMGQKIVCPKFFLWGAKKISCWANCVMPKKKIWAKYSLPQLLFTGQRFFFGFAQRKKAGTQICSPN